MKLEQHCLLVFGPALVIGALRSFVLVFEQNEFVNVMIPAAVEFHVVGE